MIEIIGQANELRKQVTCRKCLSVLRFAPIDIKKGESCDYTGDKDIYNYLSCPSCGNEVCV